MSGFESVGKRSDARGARWGIKARLWVLMVVSLFVSVLLVGNAQFNISAGSQAAYRVFTAKDATADILPPPMYVVGVRLIVSELLEGTTTIDEAVAEFDKQRGEYDDRVRYWKGTEAYGLDKHLLGEQHRTATVFLDAVRERILAPVQAGRVDAARAALQDVHALFLAHRSEVDKTVERSVAFADEQSVSFDSASHSMTVANAVLLAMAALGLGGAFWLVIRGIWNRMGAEPEALADVAHAVAAGDLTRGIRTDRPQSVAGSLEAMRLRLRELVSVADESAREVVNAAAEISAGNNDLSDRTQTLAAHVQMFREKMQQMTESIRDESGLAHDADELARQASDITRSGGEIVAQVVSRMHEISGSSTRIGEIISVINGIAFQTNILALNAAVEAARAGEQGRGFAVVASEVRSLAGRSSKASQEIGSLISESTANVDGGMALVEQAGQTMNRIVTEFEHVSSLVSRITSATADEAAEVESMLAGMSAIDDMNQQNAALVEQAAAASASLKDQADRLAESVGVFRY
ncbi:MAG: methyl-accepting chemotaxis protein [Burkholderiaceae bacterium]